MKPEDIVRKYFERKKGVRGYSLRALARDLEVSPSFLSNILKGKKKLPYEMIDRIARILDIDAEAVLAMKQFYPHQNPTQILPLASKRSRDPQLNWELQKKTSFAILRNWFYVAVLELVTTAGFDGKTSTIARRLGLAEQSADVAIRELIAAGLLVRGEDGRLSKADPYIRLSSGVSQQEIRRFHHQMLSKAQEELMEKTSEADFQKRLITGIMFTASPEKIEVAKKMLSDCLHEIAEFLSDGEGTEVYHLAGQLFPVTRE